MDFSVSSVDYVQITFARSYDELSRMGINPPEMLDLPSSDHYYCVFAVGGTARLTVVDGDVMQLSVDQLAARCGIYERGTFSHDWND